MASNDDVISATHTFTNDTAEAIVASRVPTQTRKNEEESNVTIYWHLNNKPLPRIPAQPSATILT
jgi:hypothetical protein